MEIKRPKLLVIIRHGESVRNVAKKGCVYFPNEESRIGLKGIPDYKIPLTEEGLRQAEVAGKYLRQFVGVPDCLYHSGYERAAKTAEGILSAYSVEERKLINVEMNILVRERHAGHTYDMTTKEAEEYFPYLHEYWQTNKNFLAQPPGGESLADVANRIYIFLKMPPYDWTGKVIFIVTHGGPIRCFRLWLEDWDYENAARWPKGQEPENCGITIYADDPEKEKMVLKAYNISKY